MNRYFDNAATTFPKPEAVGKAVARYINECGGTYGRSFYPRIREATALVEDCRDALGRILGADPRHLFFTSGATAAANLILKGLPLSGRTVFVSGMEHNAVMRPLQYLAETSGVRIGYLPSLPDGTVDVEAMRMTDDVALVVVNHQSNVNGVIQPLARIVEAARTVPVLADATQSLGADGLPGMDGCRLPDYVIFSGHKGLYGPTGIGGVYMKDPDKVAPLLHGGTGSASESYDMPSAYPDRMEAGTPNMAGIAGLYAAICNPPAALHTREEFRAFMERIGREKGITLHGAAAFERQGETFCITHERLTPAAFSEALFAGYGCETRPGLHCASLAHRTLGTFPTGAVRISLSPYHTPADLDYLAAAVETICSR